jgi:hypothetical protein
MMNTTLKCITVIAVAAAITLVYGEYAKAGPKIEFNLNPNGFSLHIDKGKDRLQDKQHKARRYAHKRCRHWLNEYHETGDKFYKRMYRQCFRSRKNFYMRNR